MKITLLKKVLCVVILLHAIEFTHSMKSTTSVGVSPPIACPVAEETLFNLFAQCLSLDFVPGGNKDVCLAQWKLTFDAVKASCSSITLSQADAISQFETRYSAEKIAIAAVHGYIQQCWTIGLPVLPTGCSLPPAPPTSSTPELITYNAVTCTHESYEEIKHKYEVMLTSYSSKEEYVIVIEQFAQFLKLIIENIIRIFIRIIIRCL